MNCLVSCQIVQLGKNKTTLAIASDTVYSHNTGIAHEFSSIFSREHFCCTVCKLVYDSNEYEIEEELHEHLFQKNRSRTIQATHFKATWFSFRPLSPNVSLANPLPDYKSLD